MTAASPHIHTGKTRRMLAMKSCAFFGVEYLGIELGDHHLEWDRLILSGQNLDIEASRGHGKSGFFSYCLPIWNSWRIPRNRGLMVSDTADQIADLLNTIKAGKEYVDEDGYCWRLPALADTELADELVPRGFERSWTGEGITFKNGSKIKGKSFSTRFRGGHFRWGVVDDPHGDDASYSETVRNRDCEFLARVIEPAMLPGGQLIVVGTPLHADDIHGRAARSKAWVHRKFPAWTVQADGTKKLLWPEFRSLAHLEKRLASMGEIAFRQEYLLIPATNEASLFPVSLFYERPETMATWLRLRPSAEEMKAREGWRYYAGVDIAMSANAAADYTTIVVLGVDEKKNRYIVEYERKKGMGFSAQLRWIEDILQPYHAAEQLVEVRIESNQMQQAWPTELAATTDLPIRGHKTGVEKNSLAKGVPSLRPLLENGKLRIARGDAYSQERTDILVGEMQAFGWVGGKLQGVGKHDDAVMALWLADCAVRRAGQFMIFGVGDPADASEGRDDDDGLEPPEVPPEFTTWSTRFEGAAGKALMVRQGYVTAECQLPENVAGPLIWREINAGRSPCWGCQMDRGACRGGPYVGQTMKPHETTGEGLTAPAPAVAPKGMEVGEWLTTLGLCGGDAELASLIPRDRQGRIEGWNALVAMGEKPPWVVKCIAAGKGDALYDALRKIILPASKLIG